MTIFSIFGILSATQRWRRMQRLRRRLAARGFSPRRFQLTMARTDIANYLRQAPETVSRVLRRFEQDGLLHIKQRDVEILDLPRLEALALSVLRD